MAYISSGPVGHVRGVCRVVKKNASLDHGYGRGRSPLLVWAIRTSGPVPHGKSGLKVISWASVVVALLVTARFPCGHTHREY